MFGAGPKKVYPPCFRALALRSEEGQTFETEVLIADHRADLEWCRSSVMNYACSLGNKSYL